MGALNAANYFAIAIGFFFFVSGVAILIRGKVTTDPTERFEGKVIRGFRARLMGVLVMAMGFCVVGFGFFVN